MKWNITKCRLIRLSHSNTNNDVSSVWGSQGLEVVLNSAIEEHGWWRLLSTLTSHFEANTQETVLGVICESALQFMKYPDGDADSLYFVVRNHTFKPFPTWWAGVHSESHTFTFYLLYVLQQQPLKSTHSCMQYVYNRGILLRDSRPWTLQHENVEHKERSAYT